MATFGNTTVGTAGVFNVNKLRVGRFLKPEAGKVSKLTVVVTNGSAAVGSQAKFKAVIYAVSLAGEGGALLAEGSEVIYARPPVDVVSQELDLPIPGEPELAAGEYWIGVLLGGEEHAVRLFTSEGPANFDGFHNHEYTLGAPDPFGEMGRDQFQLSLYATYTPTPPSITKPADQTNTVGVPINEVLFAAENWTSVEAGGLPPGLSINAVAGRIVGSGTPLSVGASTVTVTVHGPGGEASTTFLWHAVSAATAGTWGGFTAASPIPANRQIGSSTAAFNRPVPPSPPILAQSAQMVAWLVADAPLGSSHSRNHFPTVYAANTDPQVEIVDAAKGFWNGKKVRIPAASKCQANGDHHLQVVISPSDAALYGLPEGSTADFWQVKATGETIEYEGAGSKLKVSSSGLGNMMRDLLGGNSVAANFDLNAGVIRAPEWKAGVISHALVAFVHNCRRAFVYPANHSDGEQNGLPTGLPSYAPCMGQRFFLEVTPAEIAAMGLPLWLKAVVTALATYGFYVEDTGDTATGFRMEDGAMYDAFGSTNLIERIGQEQGVEKDGEGYRWSWALIPKWAERLRALAPPPPEGQAEPVAPARGLLVRRAELFPPGALVAAYLASGERLTGVPSGAVYATATVDPTGLLDIAVPANVDLVLWAVVAGEDRYLRVSDVVSAPAPSLRERVAQRRRLAGC